jgi:hypothetical protein
LQIEIAVHCSQDPCRKRTLEAVAEEAGLHASEGHAILANSATENHVAGDVHRRRRLPTDAADRSAAGRGKAVGPGMVLVDQAEEGSGVDFERLR